MRKQEVEQLVNKQFALDYNCKTEDFDNKDTLVTIYKKQNGARKFENEDSLLSILSYNGKLIITADEKIYSWCNDVLKEKLSPEWCFDINALMSIEKKLNEFGYQIEQCHLYFLPEEINANKDVSLRWYEKDEIPVLESDERIDESFLFEDYIEDMLGVTALSDNNELIAVAGASNNGEYMWEIGVDSFVPGKGLGQAVVGNLASELLNRGKVPFYGTAISHLASQRVALGAGMRPAFTELRSIKMEG